MRNITSLSDFTSVSAGFYDDTMSGYPDVLAMKDNGFVTYHGGSVREGAITGTYTEFTFDFTMSTAYNDGPDNFSWYFNGVRFYFTSMYGWATIMDMDAGESEQTAGLSTVSISSINANANNEMHFRIVVTATSVSLYAGANDVELTLVRTIEKEASPTTISYSIYLHASAMYDVKLTYMG